MFGFFDPLRFALHLPPLMGAPVLMTFLPDRSRSLEPFTILLPMHVRPCLLFHGSLFHICSVLFETFFFSTPPRHRASPTPNVYPFPNNLPFPKEPRDLPTKSFPQTWSYLNTRSTPPFSLPVPHPLIFFFFVFLTIFSVWDFERSPPCETVGRATTWGPPSFQSRQSFLFYESLRPLVAHLCGISAPSTNGGTQPSLSFLGFPPRPRSNPSPSRPCLPAPHGLLLYPLNRFKLILP